MQTVSRSLFRRSLALVTLASIFLVGCRPSSETSISEVVDEEVSVPQPVKVLEIKLGSLAPFLSSPQVGVVLQENTLVITEEALEELIRRADSKDQAAREALGSIYLSSGRGSDARHRIANHMCRFAENGDLGEAWFLCVLSGLASSDRERIDQAARLIESAAGILNLAFLTTPDSNAAHCDSDSFECRLTKPPLSDYSDRFRAFARMSIHGYAFASGPPYSLDSHARAEIDSFSRSPIDDADAPLLRAWTLNAISIAKRLIDLGHADQLKQEMRRIVERIGYSIAVLEKIDTPAAKRLRWLARCQLEDALWCGNALSPAIDIKAPFTEIPGGLPFETRCSEAQSRLSGFLDGEGGLLDQVSFHQLRCLWTGEEGRQDPDLALKLARLDFIADRPSFAAANSSDSVLTDPEHLAGMLTLEESPTLSPRAAFFVLSAAGGDPIIFGPLWKREEPTRSKLGVVLGPEISKSIRVLSDSWNNAMKEFSERKEERHTLALLDFLGFVSFDIPGWSEAARSADVGTKTGSGFYVAKDAILTNHHVVDGCSRIAIGQTEVTVIAQDASMDLALLRAPESADVLDLLTDAIAKGADVKALGFPLGDAGARQLVVTKGNVSALAGPSGDTRFIQFTAPVQPGSSGGPLLTEANEVVGVVTSTFLPRRTDNGSTFNPQNMNYAVRAEAVHAFLRAHEVVTERGWFSFFHRGSPEKAVVYLSCTTGGSAAR